MQYGRLMKATGEWSHFPWPNDARLTSKCRSFQIIVKMLSYCKFRSSGVPSTGR